MKKEVFFKSFHLTSPHYVKKMLIFKARCQFVMGGIYYR